MKKYSANTPSPYGLYVSFSPADIRFVGSEGETLEGRAKTYRKLPTALVVLSAPVLGGAFVLAFPLVVIFAIASIVTHLAVKRVRKAAERRVYLIEHQWQPQATFLNGEQKAKSAVTEKSVDPNAGPDTEPDASDPYADLREEIARRKNQR